MDPLAAVKGGGAWCAGSARFSDEAEIAKLEARLWNVVICEVKGAKRNLKVLGGEGGLFMLSCKARGVSRLSLSTSSWQSDMVSSPLLPTSSFVIGEHYYAIPSSSFVSLAILSC